MGFFLLYNFYSFANKYKVYTAYKHIYITDGIREGLLGVGLVFLLFHHDLVVPHDTSGSHEASDPVHDSDWVTKNENTCNNVFILIKV